MGKGRGGKGMEGVGRGGKGRGGARGWEGPPSVSKLL